MLNKSSLPAVLRSLLTGAKTSFPSPGSEEASAAAIFLYCDESLLPRLIQEGFALSGRFDRVQTFSGKQPAEEAMSFLGTCGGLFGSSQPVLVTYLDKLSAKQAEAEQEHFKRLPTPLPAPVFILLPLAARAIEGKFKQDNFKQFLCWPPSGPEVTECVALLLKRYPNLTKLPANGQKELCEKSIELHNGLLQPIDDHFKRMESSGLPFEECIAGSAEVGAFDVVDALCGNNPSLFFMRLQQSKESGESASAILAALSYFCKQLLAVHSELEKLNTRQPPNWRQVFENAGVSFPAQGRIQKAVNNISAQSIGRFYLLAPQLEMRLRRHNDPFSLLAVELSQVFSYTHKG